MGAASMRGGALGRGGGLGWWFRPWLLLLLVGLLLVWSAQPRARGLDGRVLDGPRGPACLEVAVAVDVSGSMAALTGPREAALGSLLRWLPTNLRDDDHVVVVDFAGDATTRLPATTVPAVGTVVVPAPGVPTGVGTSLAPALAELPPATSGGCDRAVVLLSDLAFDDLPPNESSGREMLRKHGVHDLVALVPGAGLAVPSGWPSAFPSVTPVRFDGTDPDATAVAFGEAIAALTGQTLRREDSP